MTVSLPSTSASSSTCKVTAAAPCPAGIDIPTYVNLIGRGHDAEAIEVIRTRARPLGLDVKVGFAPGLSNITCGEAIRKLDVAESAIARVGGIPRKDVAARNPLRYMITWAFWHVLREYVIKVNVLKDGSVGRVYFEID